MDLRSYYKKIKELENTLNLRDIVIVSKPTVDGGKAGIVTEVPVGLGCRLIVEEKARLASEEELSAYRKEVEGTPASVRKEPPSSGKSNPVSR